MKKNIKNIYELIGNTPLVKLNAFSKKYEAEILVKLEFFNPGSSVKDRIAYSMIVDAEKKGLLKKGSTIIEPTSGNTGIGLAWIGAAKGYKVVLVMPDTMTIERRKLLKAYGAEIVLTEGVKGMNGAIEEAKKLLTKIPNSFVPQQFQNPANPEIHRKTTAEEIWKDTNGEIDIFIASIGTGGTITGVGEVLKERNNQIKVVAVEPKDSAVLSGGQPGPHMIQGIGAGFIPDILNTDIYDEIIQVSNEDAFNTSKQLAKDEAILAGVSSGANVFAAAQIASRPENKGKTIVTLVCDTGERYLSTTLFEK